MPPHRPRRSVLFLPASNARAIEKARTLPADVIVLDLEDAVGPEDKMLARIQAVDAVRARAFGDRETIVRINGLDTEEGLADLDAVVPAAPDAILLPKVEDPEQVDQLSAAFDDAGAPRGLALWLMIETPKAVLNVARLAELGARRRVGALLAGVNDLAAALRLGPDPDRTALTPLLVQIVVAARAHGLCPLDSVYNQYGDIAGFSLEARRARQLGFDGKCLIHPSQIEPAHAAFAPSAEELLWARRIVAAFAEPDHASRGAIAVDGRMVERLHLAAAERLLALAGEIG